MNFMNFLKELLLCTDRNKGPLTRKELVYASAMFKKIEKIEKQNDRKNTLIMC